METTIDAAQLQARLEEFLARAARGERILVRDQGGRSVALGPADAGNSDTGPRLRRQRYRSDRTIAEVLAEDRGV